MRLRILAIGKLKQPGLESLVADYCKRSRAFLPVELVHVRHHAPPGAAKSSGQRRQVVLDERGERLTTEVFAASLGRWRDAGVREVEFLIGDAHGFDDAQRKAADRVVALSPMTLPHRLAQVMLVEQLYRAGTVLAGHPYHH